MSKENDVLGIIAEVLDTVVNSLPIDPADQARLKARVADLHDCHKESEKERKASKPAKAPAKKPAAKPAETKPSVTTA